MWFGVISLFPEMFQSSQAGGAIAGVVGQALDRQQIQVQTFNPRDFTQDKHRTVDDRPYGGGPGMVMMYEPLSGALQAAKQAAPVPVTVVMMSPQGQVFKQDLAQQHADVARTEGLIFICGRYEGIDQRFVDEHVDQAWSLGDFVLSGGEIAAIGMLDAIVRLIPGVLGNQISLIDESHLASTLDYPHYTRPEQVEGFSVPNVVMGGNHKAIAKFRRREALVKTFEHRPDLLQQQIFDEQDRKLLQEEFEAKDA